VKEANAELPPEPLTEFQKFVASTTGTILPIFGADLFNHAPSTFAPVDMAPVPPDYVVGPGDELRIRIWGPVDLQANLRVDRSGQIYLPQIGNVHVAGLAFSELETHLRDAVGRVYRNFDLDVDMGRIRSIQVYLAGAARKPGVYTVSSLSTLVDALFASGGPAVEGSMRSIELRRDSTVVTRFDLYDLLIRGNKTKDAKLLPGDIIYIPPVGSQIAVLGSVHEPGVYELLPQETLGDALAEAGGVSAVAAEARVSIERTDEHRGRLAMEVGYDAVGKSTLVAEGDIIRIYSIVPRYEKTVTLRGNVANPGRFAWHEGMRLSDLIPDKESVLTRNYWWRRAQMGLPGPEFLPISELANPSQPNGNRPVAIPLRERSEAPQQSSPTAAREEPNQYSAEQFTGVQDQNFTAQPEQRAGNTSLANIQVASSSRSPVSTPRTDVQPPVSEIDWDYAVIERLDSSTLKMELIPFDLGKLVLQHDSAQDLTLLPNDIVSVFSQSDIRVPLAQETKLVRLEGEFTHAGFYSAKPGETLRQLVERAGGITANAYLYGSEFTRESTRSIQQVRINEYVQSLALNIQRGAIQSASSASPQGVAGVSTAQSNEQNLLALLRQIRATGRIVLQLGPDSVGVTDIPDIPVEDGDQFIVPHTPTAVNIVGAVYNQNSFVYRTGVRAGTYLRMAGGPNRDADTRRAFVIRANGEVISRNMTNGFWGNEFNDLHIYPGDTIVIPEKSVKPSALYGVMNWSQMFSQLALGAASLSVIR